MLEEHLEDLPAFLKDFVPLENCHYAHRAFLLGRNPYYLLEEDLDLLLEFRWL